MRRSIDHTLSAVLFSVAFLLPVSLFGQSQNAKPDDSTANGPQRETLPTARANHKKEEAVDQDDPGLRLEWEKKAWGTANAEFRRHSLREAHKHNQRLGRTREGAEAGVSLGGADASVATQSTVNVSGPAWIPIGPTGADFEQNGPFTGLFRDSGRARTILPHPTDPNTLYFLTSGGGLWKTTNFESSSTTWRPLTDNLPTTGGGAVAFGRTPNVLYLGLGDPYDQILVGGAMVKSSNGGDTWDPMVELDNAVSIRAVAVDTSGPQDIVMVATEIGMYRSVDSGVAYAAVGGVFSGKAVWSIVKTSAGWLASAQPCSTIGNQCGTATILYLSPDAGASWTPITNAGNVFTASGRTTLGVGLPSDSVVYAYSANQAETAFLDVYRSSDGGQTWVANAVAAKAPTNPITGSSTQTDMNICHAQCWYNQMILVDPTDATRNTVYIGGDLATARTTDGANTWTITSWWLYNQVAAVPYAHADFHAAAYKSTGTPAILFGSDGGLFISTDNAATFTSDKNNGLTTHMFYTIAGTPSLPNFVIGGMQDNGTRVRQGNTSTYNQIIGGDGVGADLSQANTNTSFGSVQRSGLRANLSGSEPDVYQRWIAGTTGLTFSDAGFLTDIFAPPASLDSTGRIFFTFTNTRVYKTINGGLNWTVIARVNTAPTIGLPAGRTFRSTAYDLGVSPLDLNRIAIGASGGFIDITTDGGINWVDLNMISLVPGYGSFVSNVTWADNQTIWIASAAQAAGSNRVLKGTIPNEGDSWTGATWVVKQNGLPDLPVTKLILDPRDATRNTLYAATHVGVYRTTDGGNAWLPYGTGLPNVRVSDMYMPPDGGYLRIATYGRGVWEIPQLEYVSAIVSDDGTSCDHDGVLDEGETGHLTITLHNQGSNTLSNTTATVTSSNPHVTFPGGNSVTFPPAAGYSDTVAALAVALNGSSGVETTDFTISFTDANLSVASPLSAVSTQRLNYDEVPNGTSTETFESFINLWTASGTATVIPNIQNWRRVQIAPLQHVWNGPDNNGLTSDTTGVGTDNSLISPSMHVGTGALSIAFSHRYSFESGSADGGVVEISTDGGSSWTDIGAAAYTGALVVEPDHSNPLEGRAAFVNRSATWPSFIVTTLNLGTTYANQDIHIRFRVGADSSMGAPGWDIDNIAITGLTVNPFIAINPHNSVCATSGQLVSSQNPSSFGQLITLSASVSGGVSTATGSINFKEGSTVLGSSNLNNGQALLNISTLGVGAHDLIAEYSGDTAHAASTSNALVQNVGKADQTITFGALDNKTFGDPDFAVSATASSSLAVSFAASGNCSIAGSTVHLTVTGSCTITAAQAGNSNFNPAADVPQSLTISKATPLIMFSCPPVGFDTNPHGCTAAVTGVGNVTVSGSTTITYDGNPALPVNAGTYSVGVSFTSSDSNYSSATGSGSLTIAEATPIVTVACPNSVIFDGNPHTCSAGATGVSNVPVSGSATLTYNGGAAPANAGTYLVVASFTSGDSNYANTTGNGSLTIGRASQTITFGALANKTFGNPDFAVSAAASSSLTVVFAAGGNCTVSGSTVHLTGAGSCTITASQSGNGNYNPAASVPRSFTINPGDDFTIVPTLPSVTVAAGQSVTDHITITPNPATLTALTFTCSGLPAKTICTFAPNPVPPSLVPTDVVMTITTTASTTSALERPRTLYAVWLGFASLGLIGTVFIGAHKKSRKVAGILGALSVMVVLLVVGCGGQRTPVTVPGTPAGTSTVTVTGSTTGFTHSTTFTLTVN